MGETIEFPSNGTTGHGYLAAPASGSGPGVVVIQEYWGLVPHIEEVCDRFAAEGFLALAPDFYHGKAATEPDEAGKLMMAMELAKAGKDFSGAVDVLLERSGRDAVGAVGFCMGGGLALVLATQRPDAVRAVVPFYGLIPWPEAQPDWSALNAAVLGHFAGNDGFATPEYVAELESSLREGGNDDVTIHHYPGTEHAFFNDTRPEVYDEAASRLAWQRTLDFLRAHLG
ncbi:MAG TPA: dienelactone hydrolase family protein [Acidimicrobiales bacterium]|nr:dienelactone hydrolase family protein [Acidimicrobiales bacterium]